MVSLDDYYQIVDYDIAVRLERPKYDPEGKSVPDREIYDIIDFTDLDVIIDGPVDEIKEEEIEEDEEQKK